jgi:dihydrolipoamide dehydrogenase
MFDVLVVGGGPAGLVAALRAADLGAKTALVTRDELGGMAANDGPVPVRTLAHAARLVREARQLPQYGIATHEPTLDYPRLLERVRAVVADVRAHSTLFGPLEAAGVTLLERAGAARFLDPHTLGTASGLHLEAHKIILCTGGVNRRLPVPGAEHTATHSDAWALTEVPESMLVIGAGATGVQVASIFSAFGSRVELLEAGPRILATEDEDVSVAVRDAFRASGMTVREAFGRIESFEKTPAGVRLRYSKDGVAAASEAAVVVVAIGWVANTADLDLAAAGVETDTRGFVRVDAHLQTTSPHVFAAGDVTGSLLLASRAIQEGFVAGTNAVLGPTLMRLEGPTPVGSFTDPEYAQVGLHERDARAAHDVAIGIHPFDSATRTIIDGRTVGFCKVIADRTTGAILGCHVVGERAVDIVQVAAVAMAGRLTVHDLARLPLSFPTHAGILGRTAAKVAQQLTSASLDREPVEV